MSKMFPIVCAFVAFAADANSQGSLILAEGESYVFAFETMNRIGHVTPPIHPFQSGAGGHVFGTFSPSLPLGAELRVEMYEDFLFGTLVGWQSLRPLEGFPTQPGPFLPVEGAWQDLQGVVRFTAVAGTIGLVNMYASVFRPEGDEITEYAVSLHMIPEPSSVALGMCGTLVFILVKSGKLHRFLCSNFQPVSRF